MKRFSPFSGRAGGLFTFALLCVYAIIACLLLLSGLRVYRGVKAAAADNYNGRTATAYIAGKLRSGASPSVSRQGALTLSESIGGKLYNTYIYCRNGSLCEYFAAASRAFDETLGEPVADASALTVTQTGKLLSVTLTSASGTPHTACYYFRGGKETP